MRDFKPTQTILDAKAANGVGTTILVEDFRHLILSLDSAGTANMTVKVQGSVSDTAPTFTAAQTVANQWDFVEIIDLEDQTAIDGDTGVAFSAADDHRQFEINTNGLKYINLIISSWVAGALTAKVKAFND